MADPREQIMARLVQVAADVTGIRSVVRNIVNWSGTTLPAIAVLEGDEEADDEDKITRTTMIPRRVRMVPQLVIAVGDVPEDVGTSLNTLRARLMVAVLSDEQLLALTINSLGIRYMGTQSDLALGRQMVGQFVMSFRISYWLDPATL